MATENNFKVKKGLDVSSGSVNVTNNANSSAYADLAIFHTGNLEVGRIAYTGNDNLQIGGSAANHAGLNFIGNAITPMGALSETNNAIDLGSSTYKFRKLFLGTEIDAGNFKYYSGKVTIRTEENTKPLEISRDGSSASQVMKIGVSDREADFVYIEDTQGEGKNAFGQYRFFLGGNHTNTENDPAYVPEDADIVALRIEKDNLSVPGDITVAGDINVAGSLNTTSTTNLTVEDKTITLNQSASDSSGTADGAGIIIQDAVDSSNDASILWNQTTSAFDFTHKISVPSLTSVGNTIVSGNVGIGTSTASITPASALHIHKFTSTSSSGTGTTLVTLENDVGTGPDDSRDIENQKTFIDFKFRDSNGNETPQVQIGAEVGPNGDADSTALEGHGNFVVYTNNADSAAGASSPIERFRVDYQGNVGIGTNDPGSILHVYDTTGNGTTENPMIEHSGASTGLQFKTTHATFGSDTDQLLSGLGQFAIAVNQANNALLADSACIRMMLNGSSAASEYGRFTTDGLMLSSGGAHTPTERLHIRNGSINVTPIQFAADQEAYILKYGAYNANDWDGMGIKMKSDASGIPYISVCAPAGVEVLNVKGSKVGIGIEAPTSELHINKQLDGDASQLEITNTQGAALKLGITGNGADQAAHIKTHAAEDLEFHIGQAANTDVPKFIMAADGRFGVNIADPSASIHVKSNDDHLAIFKSNDNKAYIQLSDDDTTGYLSVENGAIAIGGQTGNHANNINVDVATGYVGIKRTSPRGKIDIAGSETDPNLISGSLYLSHGLITRHMGNELFYGDRWATYTQTGTIVGDEQVFRPGDSFASIESSTGTDNPVSWTLETTGSMVSSTTNVNGRRLFVAVHNNSFTADLKIEVKNDSDVWETCYDDSFTFTGGHYFDLFPLTNITYDPGIPVDDWPIHGIKFTIDNYGTDRRYIAQIGIMNHRGADRSMPYITTGGGRLYDDSTVSFGNGQDLSIYHDGNDSYIDEDGTGILSIRGLEVAIGHGADKGVRVFGSSISNDVAVQLRYDDDNKLETVSTGVDVTGNMIATGTIGNLDSANDIGQQLEKGTADHTTLRFDSDRWRVYSGADGATGERLTVTETGNVGIGRSDPTAKLHVKQDNTLGAEFTKSTYASAVIEAEDAHLELASSNGATWGSSILLKEQVIVAGGDGDNINDTVNVWAISRQTTNSGDGSLRFNWGANNDHNINSPKVIFYNDGDVKSYGRVEASDGFRVDGSNTIIQRKVDSWIDETNDNSLHDIIHSSYLSNLNDYVYLKAAGNNTGSHGTTIVSDNALWFGRTDTEVGHMENDALAPFGYTATGSGRNAGANRTAFKVSYDGHATIKNSLGIGPFPTAIPVDANDDDTGPTAYTNLNSNNNDSLGPQAPLHVYDTGGSGVEKVIAKFEKYISDVPISSPNKLSMEFKIQDTNNGDNVARILSATANDHKVNNDGTGGNRPVYDMIYGDMSEASTHLIFGTSNGGTYTEKAIITSTGDLGVGGDDSFNKHKHVNTGDYFKPATSGKFITVDGGGHGSFINLMSDTVTDDDQVGGIFFTATAGQLDAHKQIAGIDVLYDTHANAALGGGHMKFYTKPIGGGSNAARMTILSNGNIQTSHQLSVNTTSSDRQLHVGGTAGVTVAAMIEASDGNQASLDLKNTEGEFRLITDAGELSIFDQTDSTERFRIDTAGNVGVNTASPDFLLDVHSPTSAHAAGDYPIGVFQGAIDHSALLKIKNNNAGAGAAAPKAGIDLDVRDHEVGDGTNRNRALFVLRSRTNTGANGETAISAPRDFRIHVNNKATLTASSGTQPSAGSNVPGTLAMIVQEDGDVGIGTANPESQLNVVHQITADVYQYPLVVSGIDAGNTVDQTVSSGIGMQFKLANNHTDGQSMPGAAIVAVRENDNDDRNETSLVFQTSAHDANLTEKLKIESTGVITVADSIRSDMFGGSSHSPNSFLDFDNDTVSPNSAGSNGTLLSSVAQMDFIIDSNNNGTNDAFTWLKDNVDASQATQLARLNNSGDLEIIGALSATTKSFDIEHPTKEGKRLHHGVLEGPEHAVYVRGRSSDGVIELPDYWTGLVHEHTITVQLTPIGYSTTLYVKDIVDNTVEVQADCEYFYFIQAERKDVDRFEVEYAE